MAWSGKHLEVWAKGAKRKSTQRKYDYRNKLNDRNALAWRRIDAIIGELESLDRQTNGVYRDTYDWEPLSIINRLLLRTKHGKR